MDSSSDLTDLSDDFQDELEPPTGQAERSINSENTSSSRRKQRKKIRELGTHPSIVTVFENLEQSFDVRDERLDGIQRGVQSVCTGYAVKGIHVPEGGLVQSMMDYMQPLRVKDIIEAPAFLLESYDETNRQISDSLIHQAIQQAFPCEVDYIYRRRLSKGEQPTPIVMPTVDKLPTQKTESHSFDPIHEEEGSRKGVINILKNIFQDQYKLQPDKTNVAWSDGLRLVYGDQQTWARLWGLKGARAEQKVPGYGRMKWLLPVPALFHIRMCYLKCIHQFHWEANAWAKVDEEEADGEEASHETQQDFCNSRSFLRDQRDYWNRHYVGDGAKCNFWGLEELIIHSWQARIVAALWIRLRPSGDDVKDSRMDDRVKALSPKAFETHIEIIRRELLEANPRKETDPERHNHIRFMRMVKPYLMLKHGVKHGDIGLISLALDLMCLYFHGTESNKCATLMLFWKHHTGPAADTRLRKALLANSLVNLTGEIDGWKEVDMHINGQHRIKSTSTDLRTYAEELQKDSMQIRPGREHIRKVANLSGRGFGRLPGQVWRYNLQLPGNDPDNMSEVEEMGRLRDELDDMTDDIGDFFQNEDHELAS